MTTPIEQPAAVFICRRAYELLGMAWGASPDEQQRRALELLDHCEYEPTAAQQDAIELVFARIEPQEAEACGTLSDFREELEAGLAEEIEQFAAGFFALEPAERIRTWSGLRRRAGFSAVLRRRLAKLKQGLSLDTPALHSLGQDLESRLVRWILTLYLMRPAARTTVWIAVRDEIAESPREWEAAAGALCKRRPQIAALVPDLIEAARSWRSKQRTIARLAKKHRRDARRKRWADWRSRVFACGSLRWVVVVASIMGFRFLASLPRTDSGPKTPDPTVWHFTADGIRATNRLPGSQMWVLSRPAIDFLPAADQEEIEKRLRFNRRLTAEQEEKLAQTLESLHMDGVLRQLRDFQSRALPDWQDRLRSRIIRASSTFGPVPDEEPRPSPPDLPQTDDVWEDS